MRERPPSEYVKKSYRYLRLGLIGSATMILASLAIEWSEVGRRCFQTSVSGYYYTPARAVFVSALVAIGVALIVIKGRGVEDVLLNVAGMLAPIVAFVPTRNVGLMCWSSPPAVEVDDTTALADWVLADIDNNLRTLIYVGLAAVVVAAVLLAVSERSPLAPLKLGQGDWGSRVGVSLTAVGILVVLAAWNSEAEWFREQLHNGAAIGMFAFLAAASAVNAWEKSRTGIRSRNGDLSAEEADRIARDCRWYFWLYLCIPLAMALAALGIWIGAKANDGWRHPVLVLEMVEIGLFATFWIVQTKEHWNEPIGLD